MITHKERIEAITKKLMDEGKIIAAGWVTLQSMVMPESASATQRIEMRKAFYAGAQHLFACIMTGLDGDDDLQPTDADLHRMDLISAELEAFAREFETEIMNEPPAGNA